MTAPAPTPVRIQRKRTKGFDLQAASRPVNGLECVYVGRPTMWGNPFHVQDAVDACDCRLRSAHVYARQWFVEWLNAADDQFAPMREYAGMKGERDAIFARIRELRGKNLACFCNLDHACHADVLLELANRPICEAVE